jgi:hypothetical protein
MLILFTGTEHLISRRVELNYATIQYVHSVEIASRLANVSQDKRRNSHRIQE